MTTFVAPFQGIRFNPKKVDLNKVLSPSYDVVSSQYQQRYYAKPPQFKMIEFLKSQAKINPQEHPINFKPMGDALSKWLRSEHLLEDAQPGIYLYRQEFPHPLSGNPVVRHSLLASVQLDPARILPHEKTFEDPIQERVKMLTDCPYHLDPVLAFYSQPAFCDLKSLSENTSPIVDFSIRQGFHHRLVALNEPKTIESIQDYFSDKDLYIADGHHRFESARRFGLPRIMMALVSGHDDGLLVLPTHRVLRQSMPDFLQKIPQSLSQKNLRSYEELLVQLENTSSREFAFGVIQGGHYTLVSGSKKENEVDVDLLRYRVIEPQLKFSPREFEAQLAYTDNPHEAHSLVQEGSFSMALLLRSTPIQQISRAARAGKTLPPKATYFYPKPFSGLILEKIQ